MATISMPHAQYPQLSLCMTGPRGPGHAMMAAMRGPVAAAGRPLSLTPMADGDGDR